MPKVCSPAREFTDWAGLASQAEVLNDHEWAPARVPNIVKLAEGYQLPNPIVRAADRRVKVAVVAIGP